MKIGLLSFYQFILIELDFIFRPLTLSKLIYWLENKSLTVKKERKSRINSHTHGMGII